MMYQVEITKLLPPDDNGFVGISRGTSLFPDQQLALRYVRDFNAQFAPTGRIARLMQPGEQLPPLIEPRPRVRGKDRQRRKRPAPGLRRNRPRVPGSRRSTT